MPTLDIYKQRKENIIKIGDIEFKIPNEYTVEEVERLIEVEAKRESLEEEVSSSDEEKKQNQLKRFWQLVFDQLEIIFQHHQPDITADALRSMITHKEALEVLGFYDKYRNAHKIKGQDQAVDDSSKKKILA